NIEIIRETLEKIIAYDGEMPGASEIECGNYRNLDLGLAKAEAERYLEKIQIWTDKMLEYK
ncbi:MAG: S-ribosylhomocysteine lyase, partial [Clostridia bacterium]|nr:S-ribosylhomocysteine lyase [Clostridia bacterium]